MIMDLIGVEAVKWLQCDGLDLDSVKQSKWMKGPRGEGPKEEAEINKRTLSEVKVLLFAQLSNTLFWIH